MNHEHFECLGDEFAVRAEYTKAIKLVGQETPAEVVRMLNEMARAVDPDLYLWGMYGGVWAKPK